MGTDDDPSRAERGAAAGLVQQRMLGGDRALRNPAVLTIDHGVAVAVTEVLAPGFTDPAAHRLADTGLGAAIAIVVGYVLFPDREREEAGGAGGRTGLICLRGKHQT